MLIELNVKSFIGWRGKNKSSGPDYCWHFDRDDTLNPCGLSIQRLRESNADKMEYRKTLRLARRKYISPDPNYFWLIFALWKKWNKFFFNKCDQCDTFTEKILNGKLRFLCSVGLISWNVMVSLDGLLVFHVVLSRWSFLEQTIIY